MLPAGAAVAVGADAHRGLDLGIPPGAGREPGVALAQVPRYLAVKGRPLPGLEPAPWSGDVGGGRGGEGGGLQAVPKLGYRQGARFGSRPGPREQPGLGHPGLDPSQRTHWIDRLSWTLLTVLPIVPLAVAITISAVLLIKGRGTGRGHPDHQTPQGSCLCPLFTIWLPPRAELQDQVLGIT